MDLNELHFHHQLAIINRNTARSIDHRTTYFDLVEHYAKRIRQARAGAGIPRIRWDDRSGAAFQPFSVL
ncbi:hypothetical protein [Altererythrobacter sp. GH1-8]|uniref:hypothetical protein n=1 Tax=Altererythrobacter sp. GH1-8 TaxID=3349333 RepID=UPI00374D0FC2